MTRSTNKSDNSLLISICDLIEIDSNRFRKSGAFNLVLGADTRLFVDPFLLPKTTAPELNKCRPVILERFSKVLKLLRVSKSKSDRTWKQAAKFLHFPEPKGFNLGYGGKGSSGSGMGKVLTEQILTTAAEIVSKGIEDPEIFELVGLFEEGVGADRISDMVCGVLQKNFLQYSHRVYQELSAQNLVRWKFGSETFLLPKNPFKKEPVILVPSDILRELPVAYDYDDISRVCRTNEELRDQVNQLIGEYWSDETRKMPKAEFRRLLLDNPEILRELIKTYRSSRAEPYQVNRDPRDFQASYQAGKDFARSHPLALALASEKREDILAVVNKICHRFKENIEDTDLWRELYKDIGCTQAKSEKTPQRLFYAIATEHCDANGLDITPEANAGRGPVDFKVSMGTSKVLVEVKLAHNTKLAHAFDTQVSLYQKAERTKDAIILIVKVKEKNPNLDSLLKKVAQMDSKKEGRPSIIVVDGLPKSSASKA